MPDTDRAVAYVLLVDRGGVLDMVGDRLHPDLEQTRQLADQFQQSATSTARYVVGAVVPVDG